MVSCKDVKGYLTDCSLIVWDFKSYQIESHGILKDVKNFDGIVKDFSRIHVVF